MTLDREQSDVHKTKLQTGRVRSRVYHHDANFATYCHPNAEMNMCGYHDLLLHAGRNDQCGFTRRPVGLLLLFEAL